MRHRASSPLRVDGRTVSVLAVALLAAVFVGAMASSFVRRWVDREALIAERSAQVGRVRALVRHEAALDSALRDRRAVREATPGPVVARTPSLAAAEVQTLVQRYADESHLTVSQLDVTGEPDSLAGVEAVPATVSAIGDIYGVTDLLSRLQGGARLIEIRELTVTQNPVLRGELLQVSVSLRAPFLRAP